MGAEATFSGTEVSPVSKRAHASKVETKGLMIWLRSVEPSERAMGLLLARHLRHALQNTGSLITGRNAKR
jgi:hypothetical protein